MKLSYKKFINTFLLMFVFTFAVNCAEDKKNDEKANPDVEQIPDSLITNIDPEKRKFDETQDEYQTRLAGKYNVKKRTTVNYLYDLKGKLMPNGAVSEELEFDEKGRRSIHISYRAVNQIGDSWQFAYDTDDNMTEFSSFDEFGKMKLKKELKYDKNNKVIMIKETYPSNKIEINYEFVYDGNGNLIKTIGKTSAGKETVEERSYYTFGKIKNIKMTGEDGTITSEKKYEYDNKGNLIKETVSAPNKREIVTNYSDYTGIYPGKIENILQKKIFEYDEKGCAVLDIMFNSTGGRQYKFVNEYDDKGLIIKKTRYDALDKPALIFEYKYEYYK